MQNVHFTPPQLARLFGVNVSTIKRWVDKGMLPAQKTTGGHRRISKIELQKFIKNYPKLANQSYTLSRLLKTKEINDSLWPKFYDYLKKSDTAGAQKFIEQLFLKNYPVIKILENIFTPTLVKIGNDWAQNKISIFEEHQMSFILRLQLFALEQIIPEPNNQAPKAILACAEGDHHEIPLQMIAVLLKANGWKNYILGINISATEIIKAAKKIQPHFIGITNTYSKINNKKFLNDLVTYAKKHNIFLGFGGNGWKESEKKINSPLIKYFNNLASFEKFIKTNKKALPKGKA